MSLPGVCIVCRAPVEWSGINWNDRGRNRRHGCRKGRQVCGEWMPKAKEFCARLPGHAPGERIGDDGHRSAYALDNVLRSRQGGASAHHVTSVTGLTTSLPQA